MMRFDVGSRCWCPDPQAGWIGAEIIEREFKDGKSGVTLRSDNGQVFFCEDENSLEPRNPPVLENTKDLTTLSHLNEPAILNAIRERYKGADIYTYSGIVLIATNPFADVPHLYTDELIQLYARSDTESIDPHLFAIASKAYTQLVRDGKNQTIIVSGESGAGKTVSAKYIMRYFASIDIKTSESLKHQSEMSEIEKKILATNPLMEAFGNAKTSRNDNSSRFGKYLQILFDGNMQISGARIETYLLERSRLVFQPETERNYHIFYQLLFGLNSDEKNDLNLTTPEDFAYLNRNLGYTKIENVDDAKEFATTKEALKMIGIDYNLQMEIFKILAAILHIGNISIQKIRDQATLSSEDKSLLLACNLLQLDPRDFAKWITKKQITTRSEKIVSNLNYDQAIVARDSVTKYLYSVLFEWLVSATNTVLNKSESDLSFIGVLDIFGFEHFERNSFEQFCINYANEKLQQEFNQYVFKLEQDEYIREQIEWSFIKFSDNQLCIDVIENKMGILALLDEESRLPAGSDESWTSKLYQSLDAPPHNSVFSKPRFGQSKFIVSHYAVDVAYDVEGFIDKNRDTVSEGHLEVLKSTRNATLIEIIGVREAEEAKKDLMDQEIAKRGPRMVKKKPTLGSIFKHSLSNLMSTITSTDVHYIRCIKPNNNKNAWDFDNLMVLSQLRACGVLETIKISCAGFPSKITYREFIMDYYLLLKSSIWYPLLPRLAIPLIKEEEGELKDYYASQHDKEEYDLAIDILEQCQVNKEHFQLGKTKIFFKSGILARLEELRLKKISQMIIIIQKRIKGKFYRDQYLDTINSINVVNKFCRAIVVRKNIEKQLKYNAALLIQRLLRGNAVRGLIRIRVIQIINIQSRLRQKLALSLALKLKEAKFATIIQSHFRSYKEWSKLRYLKVHCLHIQALARGRLTNSTVERLVETMAQENQKSIPERNIINLMALTEDIAEKTKSNAEHTERLEDVRNLKSFISNMDQTRRFDELVINSVSYEQAVDNLDIHENRFGKEEEISTKMESVDLEIQGVRNELQDLLNKHEILNSRYESFMKLLSNDESVSESKNKGNTQSKNQPYKISSNDESKDDTAYIDASSRMNNIRKQVERVESFIATDPYMVVSPSNTNMGTAQSENKDTDKGLPILGLGWQKANDIYESQDLFINRYNNLVDEIIEVLIEGITINDITLHIEDDMFINAPSDLILIILNLMLKSQCTANLSLFLVSIVNAIRAIITTPLCNYEEWCLLSLFWFKNVHSISHFIHEHNMELSELEQSIELRHVWDRCTAKLYNNWISCLKEVIDSRVSIAEAILGKRPQSMHDTKIDEDMSNFVELSSLLDIMFIQGHSLGVSTALQHGIMLDILSQINVMCFNDLILRYNHLSFRFGKILEYKVQKLVKWCHENMIPVGESRLIQLVQVSRLLQFRIESLKEFKIACHLCYVLNTHQISMIMSKLPQQSIDFSTEYHTLAKKQELRISYDMVLNPLTGIDRDILMWHQEKAAGSSSQIIQVLPQHAPQLAQIYKRYLA